MATRLDRLFLLLDTGSTPVVRKSAAEQLGEVQKLHPHELHNLLSKVYKYLGSSSWETRIAAGQAVEAIAKNVPQWQPKPVDTGDSYEADNGRLTLAQFSIEKVLQHGSSLLGSEGGEYDQEDAGIGLDEKGQLMRQRQLLNRRLGLDVAGGLGIQTDELFTAEDLTVNRTAATAADSKPQKSVSELLQQQMGRCVDMSARERNRAKRKARQLAKQISREPDPAGGPLSIISTLGRRAYRPCRYKREASNGGPLAKQRKTTSVVVDQPSDADKVVVDHVPDSTLNMDEMDEGPFEGFCEMLFNDLFHCSWEKRHGAATGLREVLKLHGDGVGIMADSSAVTMQHCHEAWLEDTVVRLLCVLALDRFGDFVSDEMVAPVRETCAQTVGVALKYMQPPGVNGTLRSLLTLLGQGQWEVRHGGLLGIKYLLAVRRDLTEHVLPCVLPAILHGLQDHDDDVRAVAASALVPVADRLVQLIPQQVPTVVSCLWETLLDLDDLTASTKSIMTLLSTLLTVTDIHLQQSLCQPLELLVPRLWPFLRHGIKSVRLSALETLHILLTRENPQRPVAAWLSPILQDALRHVYQRALLEHKKEVSAAVCKVWAALLKKCPMAYLVAAVAPWLGVWLCLSMQPSKLPFDPSLLIKAKHRAKEMNPAVARHRLLEQQQQQQPVQEHQEYLGGFESLTDSPTARDVCVMRARTAAGRCMGLLACYLSRATDAVPEGMESPLESLSKVLLFHLGSKSALQRITVAQVVTDWAAEQQPCLCPQEVKAKIGECLSESIYYDEIAISFTKMQTECMDFVASLKQCGISTEQYVPPGSVLTLDQANHLCTTLFDQFKPKIKPRQLQTMEERCKSLQVTVNTTNMEWNTLHVRVQSSLAGAAVILAALPEKLNPVIRPIMDSIKKEANRDLQSCSADHLAELVNLCAARSPNPNAKVVKNLCTLLCSDLAYTPCIQAGAGNSSAGESGSGPTVSGIITLQHLHKPSERSGRKGGPGRKPATLPADVSVDSVPCEDDGMKEQLMTQRRGAVLALIAMVKKMGSKLPDSLPGLWDIIIAGLDGSKPDQEFDSAALKKDPAPAQDCITALQLTETVAPSLDLAIHSHLKKRLPNLVHYLQHPLAAVRNMASRCLGTLSKVMTADLMEYVVEQVLPSLGATDNKISRQGSIEAMANIIDQLGVDVLPYIVLLVVPILGCMSDQDEEVRLMATNCFASLIRLMPLESGIQDPPSMKSELVKRKENERKFLEQLLDGSKIPDYKVPVPIKAELRRYQQEGVNWLAFLNKYKLHGILCDDMGLGKTLQSLCILAGDHHHRQAKYKSSKSADSSPLPSIVVCPPTLTGHWVYEVEKFVDSRYLNPLHYTGPPAERIKLQKLVKKHNLVVASYDIVRNDIEFFSSIKWNYCILDEGHIIKNGKTKISKSVKQLICNHRVILSGTPIQNNVLELWSLFDFLMPGFLGSEKQFQVQYGRPILQSRDAKSSSKEQEAGALAMEALHRQVLPFLLRRLKEDVLQDLPPKIIQDYYCDLSPLQIQLYEDFAKSRAKKSVEESISSTEENTESQMNLQNRSHIFQALQYLRKVCNHPALVLTPQHPQYSQIMEDLCQTNTSLNSISLAPKLTALKQLLQDCGVGVQAGCKDTEAPVVSQHRILLFCQLKGMLDIVENDLLKSCMPSVTYLRLDGSVPAGSRHGIVNRFNSDPSIDVLLLTTHVGGLGLNLTGADTVIFVEHDWNPMKDLQAMDRAHRIGQKKVVNVYRLITKGTLEEKIMGLQKFKLNIANTVISQDNTSLASMGTDQLLDLFALDDGRGQASKSQTDEGPVTAKAVLENMDELWDEKQYESEYDMDSFMKSLSKS